MATGQVNQSARSLAEVHSSVGTTQVSFWKRMFAFAGPAYLVSVGYMDPGNWATDLEGGARFGYQLLWVLVMSNAMAVLLQNLSAPLRIVAGACVCRAGLSGERRLHGPGQLGHRPGRRRPLRIPVAVGAGDVECHGGSAANFERPARDCGGS